jgi:hypothetical protein
MKTEKGLQRSAKSRLNETIRRAGAVNDIAETIRNDGFRHERMAALREETERLLQCVHEFNAYTNALGR